MNPLWVFRRIVVGCIAPDFSGFETHDVGERSWGEHPAPVEPESTRRPGACFDDGLLEAHPALLADAFAKELRVRAEGARMRNAAADDEAIGNDGGQWMG